MKIPKYIKDTCGHSARIEAHDELPKYLIIWSDGYDSQPVSRDQLVQWIFMKFLIEISKSEFTMMSILES